MAATQLISSASAGDQSKYGTGKVENAAFGVYVPGIDAAAIPRPVVSSQSRQVFDFTVAKSWDGRLDFSVSLRPVTSVGGIDSYVFGTTSIVNAAQSFTPVGIPPSAIGVPITAATSGVLLDLIEANTRTAPYHLSWGPDIFVPHGFDSSVFGQSTRIDAPLTARPVGIAPSTLTPGLLRISDSSISGYSVEFNLTEFGLPNATPSSINFVFGGAAVIVPASWLSSVVGTSTDGRNAAATIAPLGLPPETYQAPYPVVWYSGSSGRVDFNLYHEQSQTGANVAFTFWVARTAIAIGWESFETGSAEIRNTTWTVNVPGVQSFGSGTPNLTLSANTVLPTGIFSQQFGNVVTENYAAVLRAAGIPPTSVVSSPTIYLKTRYVLPAGFSATQWGTATLQNRNIWTYPGGIAPPPQTGPNGNRQIPDPWISYRVRYLAPGGIYATAIPNTHSVTPDVQRVDLAGRGIAPSNAVVGGSIQFRHREIFPISVLGLYWGNTTVKRRIFVEPTGWDSSFISSNAELLVNVSRVFVYTGEADPAQYGVATIFNWRQDVNLHNNGWYDTQWHSPVVYNLKQEIVVAPFANNVNPDQWTNYYPFVENKDRELRTFGHTSSRFGLSTWIRNNADPVKPVGTDMTLWGAGTFIAHRSRTVQPQGWDSFYNERYTVVWNKAVAIGPAGIGDASIFGRPDPVANLNREVKHHSGWLGPEWGVPFIAFARRFITPSLFYDVPASLPEVRYNPFPIAPAGIPWQGQVGGHDVRIFLRQAFPKSANVHSVPWVGEPIVQNRNITVGPYGYDQSLFGRPDIQNLVRYVAPVWTSSSYSTLPLIVFRTRTVYPSPISVPTFPVLHRIRKDSPDPPSQQRVLLNNRDEAGNERDGFGISPPGMPSPVLKMATIYPEGIDASAKFGVHEIHTNNIIVRFIFEDGLVGTPRLTLIATQFVRPQGWANNTEISNGARMTPWNIYAPSGDQMPGGYTPINYSAHFIRSEVEFGWATVTNQNRTIGPVPGRRADGSPWFDSFPMFGAATFTLRRQYVYPTGIRSLRFGQVIFLNVPQYVDLDDEMNPQGIAPSTRWGAANVHYPIVPPDPTKRVYPIGSVMTLIPTSHRVELFNREVAPQGIPHRGNPQQNLTTPWGTPLVGYPRRYTIGMGVQTLWGSNLIEFKNRPVYPVGWNNCSLEDGNFDDYRFPMKVIRVNPPVRVPAIQSGPVFGSCTVSQRVRTVYARGVDSYNSGSHSVKASSTIGAQGWESLLIGDIDRWEAGKIKAHGDDMSEVGIPRLLHPLRASGFDSGVVAAPRIAPVVSPVGIPNIAFDGPSVTNPFGCTNRVMTPLPILSTQTVPSPVVA